MNENKPDKGCGYKKGSLPGTCAPLAMSYVPMQQSANPAYEPKEALKRGTLFPGLDLPLLNMVNTTETEDTPICEMMALDFAVNELELYLDTHPGDEEAFAMYKQVMNLAMEARRRYTALYGPVTQWDMADMNSYTWVKNPWPWDYRAKRED